MSQLKGMISTVAVFLLLLRVSAQPPGFKSFLLEKDNRQIKINTLYKSHNGYLLAGTDDGLYKFDGEKYYRVNFENPGYTDTVTAIFEGRNGKTWIGFRSGRIANIINKQLVYFNPEEGTPKKKISAFIEDKEGNTWFSTNGEGIYVLQHNRLYLINEEDGLKDQDVNTLAATSNGDILAGTDGGIYICSFKNRKKQITLIDPRNGLPDYIVTTIIADSGNKFWIGLQDKGFCLYDHGNKKITIPPNAQQWPYGQVNAMLFTRHTLLLATAGYGLISYSPSQDQIKQLRLLPGKHDFNNLLEDNQGNTWMSAPDMGMIRTFGEALQLTPVPGNPVFEHIHVLLYDKHGNTWLNNEANDLLRLSKSGDSIVVKKIRLAGLNEMTDITALYQDPYNNIWVGTMGKGLFVLDPASFRYRSIADNSIYKNAGVLSISGSGNTIYVSSLQGSMMISLNAANSNIDNGYTITNFDSRNTGTNYIYSIFKDSRNRLWFATDGTGLTMMENDRFTYYNRKEQVKDDRIYSITEDRSGNIWFSTAAAGIYKFDGKRFYNYGLQEGLSTLKVSVLKTDRHGNIVIVNKKGLDILDPRTGNIFYIGSNQGVPLVNAEDIGAVTTDTAGNIMVSTAQGILTYVYPEKSIQKPTAIIESVQLFLKDLPDSGSHTFSHDENNFTFNYTGLYYSDPDKVYYKYKLEGLDSNWVITSDRSKNFPRLQPGKYTFRIQAALNKNFLNADEVSYSFTIKKAFYKTAWFIIACASLLSLLIIWYFKRREAELRRIERLRQEKIQFQFEVLRNQVNPHFLFNSFNTLISTIEDEPHLAAEYASQLSDFFRNVVTQRDKDTVRLQEEIRSLDSYLFIQEKRYGNNLRVIISVTEEQKQNSNIPPLTLQLLVENAIKHNAISAETPLMISIRVNEEDCLEVKNNINVKLSKREGAGMGLQNIINRYSLLTGKSVSIKDDGQSFTVCLPLLT